VLSNATALTAATLNLAASGTTTAATSPTFNAVSPGSSAAAITTLTVNVQESTRLNADSQTAVAPTSTSAFSATTTNVQGAGNLGLYGTAAQLDGSVINARAAAYTGALTLFPTTNAAMNFGDSTAVTGIRTIDLTGVPSYNSTITLASTNNSDAFGTGAVTINFAPTASSALAGVNVAQLGAGQSNAVTLALGANATNVTGGVNVANGISTLSITDAAPVAVTAALNGVTMSTGAGTQAASITAASAAGVNVGIFTGDSLTTTGVAGSLTATLANGGNGVAFNGGNGVNAITGGNGADSITTGSAADTVTLTGGGNDVVSSGGGNDVITTSGATAGGTIIVDGGSGTDTLVFNSAQATTVSSMSGVEQIVLTAGNTAANAVIPGSAVSSSLAINVSAAGAGNVNLTVAMDTTSVNVTQIVTGTAFTYGALTGLTLGAGSTYTITGTAAGDAITAGAFAATVTPGAGADTVTLGSANAVADRVIVLNADTGSVLGSGTASASNLVFGSALNAAQAFSTAALDKISNFGVGDTIQLYSTGTTASTFATAIVRNAGTFVDATGQLGLITGTYDSTAQTFTASTTGTSSALIYDTDGTSGAGTLNAVILVGYVDSTTNDTMASTGLFTSV